ncbi:MAG: hypothetical protein FJ030_13280 [Chloroflexi bacterium]|nr:hypothetical protein [Chloroflexota bacterium]
MDDVDRKQMRTLRQKSLTENLAEDFLQRLRDFSPEVEPIRVLRARAYKVLHANLLVRAATLGKSGRYFFGLNYIHAEEVANLDNPFFVFICGSLDQSVIIPAQVLIDCLPSISHDRNGEYKININPDLMLILNGRNNRLDCSEYANAWQLLSSPPKELREKTTAEESYHSVLQGRLLEIGNIRGFRTFSPNKSKRFNGKPLADLATLDTCPPLQFSNHDLLRQIDVLWFREKGQNFIPECAFEVELSTGTWSGVGRLATLLDYANARLYVISDDAQKYDKVIGTFSDYLSRYKHVPTYLIGDLYAAERGLRELRAEIGL